jgi:hypothetical protein
MFAAHGTYVKISSKGLEISAFARLTIAAEAERVNEFETGGVGV